MSEDAVERTEQPTPSRREKAREDGRVPRSRDLAVALSLLGGFSALYYYGPRLAVELKVFLRERLAQAISGAGQLTAESVSALAAEIAVHVAATFGPLVIVVALAALACGLLQSGLTFRISGVVPDFQRVNPLSGIQKLASVDSLGRGVFAVLKLILVGWLLTSILGALAHGSQRALFSVDGPRAAEALLSYGWTEISRFGIHLSLALVALAVADYAFQYWLHERSLRMTPQELREELLRTEGSGLIKDRRRRMWGRVHARDKEAPQPLSPVGKV